MNKLSLSRVTLWASMHSRDQAYFERTLRVLRYCNRILEPGRTLFFSHIPTEEFEWLPSTANSYDEWKHFVNFEAPKFFDTDFALQVHEDGFPIDVSQWSDDFLKYDYIGSPWPHQVVGNGGFTMESKAFYLKKLSLPVPPAGTLPDWYLCVEKRGELEAAGLTFAPFEVAARFGCEFTGFKDVPGSGFKHIPHFGFHGQIAEGDYARAWQILEASEK